jgi:hypothetical protein
MPQGVTYDVNAFLRTQGSFQKEMAGSARAADKLGRSYSSMSDRLVAGGERVRGTMGATIRDMARGAIFAGAAGLAGGVALAAREGIRFNNVMEQGALGLGTMYTTFGLMNKSADVASGKMSLFEKSVEQAEAMQQELYDIAKKSPATFEDVALAYRSMAPAVSGVTGDLKRQRDLMANMSLLGFATAGDYKQLGMDVGRIVKGMAEMDNLTFQQLRPAFEKAFETVTGEKAVADFNAQWNKAAKLDPDQALRIVEMVGESMGGEVSDAFGKSFGGMASTIKSMGQTLAGAFGKPLMDSMKRAMETAAGPDSPLKRLEIVASFAGQQLARAADYVFGKLIKGAEYVANNWAMIATKIQQAGVLAGAALKAASVVATARLVAGYGMIAVGKGAAAAKAVGAGVGRARDFGRKRMQAEHLRRGRRMSDKGPSRVQKGFGALASMLGAKVGPNLDRTVLRFGTMATMLAGASVAAGGLLLAFSGVALIVGGLAAYMISNWDKIKSSIVTAIEDGRITLVPLITALYTFWERLKLVGEAIFGDISAAGVMVGGLDMLTGAVDMASTVLGGMIRVVAFGIEAWGALKLGLAAVFQLIGEGLRVLAKIPKIGDGLDGAIGSIEKMSQATHDSAQNTFQQADKFKKAADAIAEAQLSPMQLEAAKKKAKSLEGALTDMLTGKGAKGGGRKGKATKIDQKIVINTTDPDVDRLMAGFIQYAEKQSDRRVQPYEAVEQGT